MWLSKSKQEILMITPHREQAMAELKELDVAHFFTLVFDGELYSLYVTQPVTVRKKEGDKDGSTKH